MALAVLSVRNVHLLVLSSLRSDTRLRTDAGGSPGHRLGLAGGTLLPIFLLLVQPRGPLGGVALTRVTARDDLHRTRMPSRHPIFQVEGGFALRIHFPDAGVLDVVRSLAIAGLPPPPESARELGHGLGPFFVWVDCGGLYLKLISL